MRVRIHDNGGARLMCDDGKGKNRTWYTAKTVGNINNFLLIIETNHGMSVCIMQV